MEALPLRVLRDSAHGERAWSSAGVRGGGEGLTFFSQSLIAIHVKDLQLLHQALGRHAHGDTGDGGSATGRAHRARSGVQGTRGVEIDGRTSFPRSFRPSGDRNGRGRKVPGVSHGEALYFNWEKPLKTRREEAEISLTRSAFLERTASFLKATAEHLNDWSKTAIKENPPNGLRGARMCNARLQPRPFLSASFFHLPRRRAGRVRTNANAPSRALASGPGGPPHLWRLRSCLS